MALKFRRGTTAQKSGSLAFGEPYVNTTLGTLQIGGPTGDITLSSTGTGSTGNFGAISGSGLDITGNANIAGNLTLGGQLTIGDNTSDVVNVVASLSSSLIPSETNVFDLGSATKIWRDLYISTGSIKLVNPTNNTVVSTISTNADGTTSFDGLVRANQGIFIPNSVQVSGTGGLGIGGYGDRLMLGTSGSAGVGQQSLIFADTNSHAYTFPAADGTIALTTDLSSGTTSVSNLNSFSSSALTRFGNLESISASLLVETANLELFTASLSTTSNVRFGSLGIGMVASGTSGRIDAANDIVAFSTSDVRLKENIVAIPNAIDKIRKISGNTYDWRAELKDVHGYEGNDVGVIAQEVEAVLPQLVQDRDNGYKAVKYDKLVALLIEGIKEQQQHIDNLTIQVEELKKQKGL
jgi:hypothetical protein